MPNLRPRKEEKAAVLAILESTEYGSGEEMAEAVIKEVHRLFEQREWAALAWRDKLDGSGLSLAWGPFSSETEAARFGKNLAVGGTARAIPLSSIGSMLDTEARTSKGKAKFCPNCSHPVGTHLHERQMGNCQVRGCKCKTMTLKEDT